MRRNKLQLYEDIVRICNEKHYILITKFNEFKNTKTKIKYICPAHGEREIRADCLLLGQSCSKCMHILSLRKRYDNDFSERMNKLYDKAKKACLDNGYELISPIEDVSCNVSYVKYKCPIHGIHNMRISGLIQGRGCPDCNIDRFVMQMRLSIEEVKNRLNEMNAVCLNIDEYINLETENLIFICEFCGNKYTTSLLKFMRYAKRDCPICSVETMSSGELKIYNYLCSNNIEHKREKFFNGCKDERMLPFDFYIPKCNICIEFQGQQHYHPIEVFEGESGFELRQKHDEIKRDFCKTNNIRLIEIPYWEYDNIENILNNELLVLHEDIV